ncbi:MAG: 30S ribosomal protein S17e [Candidatus Altiarchaeota archaeon]|nr:30S ribosomal protein S17e [Candidatus Altiarchaeota archaeon]
MGKIKQTYLKRVAQKLVKEYGSEFGTDFDANKKGVDVNTNIVSTSGRNKIAGCITRMIKARNKKVE